MPISSGCSAVSSNCVVWQGPDIPCIDLCTGDSITEIVSKLATALCALSLPNVDITSVDFKCLVDGLGADPTLISEALQLVVDKHCELKDIVDAITPGTDPIVALPACLQTVGVTEQPVSEYVLTVATKVCDIITDINDIYALIDALDERVTLLETAINLIDPSITLPTVDASCLGLSSSAQLEVGLQGMINQFCALAGVLGSAASLLSAISAQCVGLSSADSLSSTGTMSSLPGWVSSPATIADTIKNIWLTICDMRGLVSNLDSAVQPKCKDVQLDFDVAFNTDRTTATLQLFKYAYIPDTFINKATSNVKFTDGVTTYTDTIDVVLMANTAGTNITYSFAAMGLDRTKNITVTVESNLTTPDGDCDKLKSKEYSYSCIIAAPTSLSISPTASSAIIYWTPPATPEPVKEYQYQLYADGLLDRTIKTTLSSITIGNLDPGVDYEFKVQAIFECGVSDMVSQTFTTACYNIVSVYAAFEPCIGGTTDDHLGGEITISAPAEQDIDFQIRVNYWAPAFSSNCSNTLEVILSGVIAAGQTVGIVHACSSGVVIVEGQVCSVSAELLNGCASGNNAGTSCAAPIGLTATII